MLSIGRALFRREAFSSFFSEQLFAVKLSYIYFSNMMVKLQFVIYRCAKHLKFFSHWDTGIFTFEIKCGVRFSHHNGLILGIVPFQTVLIIPFINKLEITVYSALNFSIVIISKKKNCVSSA